MSVLNFFGWQLELTLRDDGFDVKPPSPGNQGDQYWTTGRLRAVRRGGRLELVTFGQDGRLGQIQLRLAGLDIALTVAGLRLAAAGTDYRPAAEAGNSVLMAMGMAAATRNLVRIGPVALRGPYALTFDRQDPRAVGTFDIRSDWASGRTDDLPLSIALALGSGVRVDLYRREVVVPAGAALARLRAGTDIISKIAAFDNPTPLTIGFASIAANKALPLHLKRRSDSRPVPLNLRPKPLGPHAPIEALSGDLNLLLRYIKTDGWTLPGEIPGSIVAAATLVPVDGAIQLRFNGLRNSRNQPEIWTVPEEIALGFRPLSTLPTIVAGSPMILPRDDPWNGLKRLGGTMMGHSVQKPLPMHSWFGGAQFLLPEGGSGGTLHCSKKSGRPVPAPSPAIDPGLQWDVTRPWLELAGATLRHVRPGEAYQDPAAEGENPLWLFKAPQGEGSGGVPALGSVDWAADSGPNDADLVNGNDEVNDAFAKMTLQPAASSHETGLRDESTAAPQITGIVPDARLRAGEIRLRDHKRLLKTASPPAAPLAPMARALAPIEVQIDVPEGQAAEYAVCWPDAQWTVQPPPPALEKVAEWARALGIVIDPIAPVKLGGTDRDQYWPRDFPMALAKLTRLKSLGEILLELERKIPESAQASFRARREALIAAIREVDEAILDREWVGLALFHPPVDFTGFPALQALVPTEGELAPRFSFFAVAPRAPKEGQEVAISAAIYKRWDDGGTTPPESGDPKEEASIQPIELKIGFRDRRVVQFHSRALLRFYSFLGIQGTQEVGPTLINIIGSIKETKDGPGGAVNHEVRFAAEMKPGESLVIFPPKGKTAPENFFIETIWLRRVEVVDRVSSGARKPEIQIDGGIKLKRMKGFALPEGLTDFFELLKNDLSFANLRIELDKLTGIDPRFMTIHYPSLKFDLNLPHIGLLGDALKLKFHQLIVDWGGGGFDLGSFLPLPNLNLPGIDVKLPKLVFLGRIDFGSLPELFARSLSGFSLEGAFGFNFSGGKLTGGPFLGIRGFGFSGLDLDLASFITIRIGRLALNSRKWTNGSEGAAISLEDGSLSILKYTVLERLSGGYFSLKDNGGDGFWALLSRSPSQSPNFFVDFRYAFAGRNIDFPPALARVLLVPPPQEGDSQAHDQIHRQLQTAWSNEESGGTKPPLDLYPAARGGGRGWTFGAGIDALGGALTGRALLQDGGFTGLSLKGPVLKELLGWDFAFTGIYRKDITPGEDYFYFSVTLPQFTMGTIRFMGGEIAAEIYTSGDFMADFGFPWPARQGGRAWERTIGAIVTPGQASGGAYIRKREYMQPGENRLALAGGVAIQWGLGASFGGGVFQVWVRIGLYAAMEGSITFELLDSGGVIPKLGKISAFDVQGAAGILVEGAGEIDWWVISARVGVRASAEIRTAILWRVDQPVQMAVVAELYVSAYAEACIGPSWARICRDISVGLDITVRHQLRFG